MPGHEFQRIARLTALFGRPTPPDVGIGDDCAVLHPPGAVVVTVDAAVEGVHFRRDLLSLEDASCRAVEAAASDVAAMGGDVEGVGCGLLLAWTLPVTLSDDDFDALARGAQRAADRLGARVVGGNLAAAPTLTLTTTVLGRAPAGLITRGGARPGDVVAASGFLGAAALGLRALLAGRGGDGGFAPYVARWRSPHARIDLGRSIVSAASAAIDVSDGLAQDAGHIAAASGCAIRLDVAQIPMLADQRARAAELGLDAVELALTGGEDYELLATGPRTAFGSEWTVIGDVIAGKGVTVHDAGVVRVIGAGWDHFRPSRSDAVTDR